MAKIHLFLKHLWCFFLVSQHKFFATAPYCIPTAQKHRDLPLHIVDVGKLWTQRANQYTLQCALSYTRIYNSQTLATSLRAREHHVTLSPCMRVLAAENYIATYSAAQIALYHIVCVCPLSAPVANAEHILDDGFDAQQLEAFMISFFVVCPTPFPPAQTLIAARNVLLSILLWCQITHLAVSRT